MLPDSPFDLFEQWQQQAIDAGLKDPTAVALATADPSGGLWQRLVLLKGVSDGGFVFTPTTRATKPWPWRQSPGPLCCFLGMNLIDR